MTSSLIMRSAAALSVLLLAACGDARWLLATAPNRTKGEAARPDLFAAIGDLPAVASVEDWQARADWARDLLQRDVFGYLPDASSTRVLSRQILDENAYGGRGRLEVLEIEAAAIYGDQTNPLAFKVYLVTPNTMTAGEKAPVILTETFAPNYCVLQHPGLPAPNGAKLDCVEGMASFIFGRYIARPPFEEILDRGYALATFYPPAAIADNAARGLERLAALSAGYTGPPESRLGAIGAWGWMYSRVVDALTGHDRADPNAAIAWGHSRYGKAAMVAAAFDRRIAGVITHQSGTGGASLNRGKPGESIADVTGAYPHWFAAAYAKFHGRDEALTVDQHFLLALAAPRPVLLGNARRDVWSDPAGAFRAAIGAHPAWTLLGSEGLTATRLSHYRPDDDLAFWIRNGTHGVTEEDWPAFFRFLEAHFPTARSLGGEVLAKARR